jgi:hypothetical protein
VTSKPEDTGVVLALIERSETQRLPRAQVSKDRVDRGAVLGKEDIAFLNQMFEDAQHVKPFLHKHLEWQALMIRAVELS